MQRCLRTHPDLCIDIGRESVVDPQLRGDCLKLVSREVVVLHECKHLVDAISTAVDPIHVRVNSSHVQFRSDGERLHT
jgi:hypothetical protein